MACFTELTKEFPHLSPEQVEVFVEMLEQYKMEGDFGLGKYNEKANKLFKEAKLQEILQLKAQVTDKLKTHQVKKFADEGAFEDVAEGIAAKVWGTSKPVKGSDNNYNSLWQATKSQVQNSFLEAFEASGISSIIKSGNFDKDIADAVYTLAKGNDASNILPEVRQAAELIMKFNRKLAVDEQKAGIPIAPKANYLFKQSHDVDLILNKRTEWIDWLVNNDVVDWDKSFESVGSFKITVGPNAGQLSIKKMRKALHEMADGFDFASNSTGGKSFSGGKLQLEFKSGSDFMKYNNAWGSNDTLLEGMMKSISRHSEKVSLVSIFGNNPIKKLREFVEYSTAKKSSASNISDLVKIIDYLEGRGTRFKHASALSKWSYRSVMAAKQLSNLVLLGKSGFAALLDIPTTAMTVSMVSGKNAWKAQGAAFTQFAESMFTRSRDRKEFLDMVGVALNDISEEIALVYGGGPTTKPGALSKLNNVYMTYTGVKKITELSRYGAAKLHAKEISNIIRRGSRNDYETKAVAAMGLKDSEIEILRKSIDKNGIITLESIKENSSSLNQANKLQGKYASYINGRIYEAAPAPGIKQQIQMGRHLPKDSIARLAYELVTQYKATLFKVYSNTEKFIRHTSKDGSFSIDSWNSFRSVANTGLAMSTTTFMINYLKDYATGHMYKYEDEDYVAGKIGNAIKDSGMLGVYMDYALAMSSNRVAPPVLSKAFSGIDHVLSEMAYATGISDPKKRRTKSITGDTLDNRKFLDRQIKILQKNIPNHVLWEAYKNFILEEGNARNRRR